ncbi:MAG: NAD(P)-dependent oxidoreductase [Acidobacteriota bacterium]
MSEAQLFRVGLTADFETLGRGLLGAALAEVLQPIPGILCETMPETDGIAKAEVLDRYDAVVALDYYFPAACFEGLERLGLIARWGVGYDRIEMPACTRAGVMVAITSDSVGRPVAEGILAMIFALAKGLPALDRNCRAGRWWQDSPWIVNLGGRVLGSVGTGNIAGELFGMAKGLGFKRLLTYSRRQSWPEGEALGVELVDLETVLRESDFLTVNCRLNERTRGMLGVHELSLMKPTAYLINTARGPIVDEAALLDALRRRRIAGAGLDVFDEEPLPPGHPFSQLDNVILTAHRIAKSEECRRDTSLSACRSVADFAQGRAPRFVANPEVFDHPRVRMRLSQVTSN